MTDLGIMLWVLVGLVIVGIVVIGCIVVAFLIWAAGDFEELDRPLPKRDCEDQP